MPTQAPSIRARVQTVTPAVAKRWLEANMPSQRRLDLTRVRQYAKDMINDRWLVASPIEFDFNGRLIDGQHRLRAVIDADRSIDMLVVMNLDPFASRVIDTGKTRNMIDILDTNDHKDTKYKTLVAAITRMCLLKARGDLDRIPHDGGVERITPQETLDWIERHQASMHDAAATAMRAYSCFNCKIKPAAVAYCAFLFNQIDPVACEQFFSRVQSQVRDGQGDPLVTMSRAFEPRNGGPLRVHQQVALLILVWNAWRQGFDMTKLPKAKYQIGADMPIPV